MRKLGGIAALAFVGAVVLWSILSTGADPFAIAKGVPNIVDYLGKMFPPNWKKVPKLFPPLLESLEMAVAATFWATIGALILGVLAARNINPNRAFAHAVRMLLSTVRGIPALLYALLFVSMVGLGPLAGVLGLICHTTGALGRYFAEAFELADKEPIEAAMIDGATRFQIIRYILIPEALPLLSGYILYYFEANFRQSTILGLVGAGGIGFPLMIALKLFRYQDAAICMLIILTTVFVLDRIAVVVRSRIMVPFKPL